APTMTYYLDRLQKLDGHERFCVTLNRTEEIHPAKIVSVVSYEHPQMTFRASRPRAGCTCSTNGDARSPGRGRGTASTRTGLRRGCALPGRSGRHGEHRPVCRHRD